MTEGFGAMKVSIFRSSSLLLFSQHVANGEGNSAITKVVKLLESMLEQSKEDGEEDRKLHAKFTCYCDTQESTKTQEVEDLTSKIAFLESKIGGAQGSTGKLSTECAELKADMAANEQARANAQSIRDKENAAFTELEADLEAALDQMKNAISTLSDVGADQTKSAGADMKQFMAGGAGFLQSKSKASASLKAVSMLLDKKQNAVLSSFLQAPFTGTYTSQSGEVMGIIKNMKDTFEENLADARKTEKEQKKSFDEFMDVKQKAFDEMAALYDEKQSLLGDNDDELASRRKALANAEEQKAIKEEFLADLIPLCEERTKEYEVRKGLRANEDAALAEALAILNSDAAFGTFQKVDATDFLQRSAVNLHDTSRDRVEQLLRTAAGAQHSKRLAQIAASLEGENAFTEVLGEIDTMLEVIAEEGKAEKEKLDWCRDERTANDKSLGEKNDEIAELKDTITTLTNIIEEPESGLKALIAADEASLVDNANQQKEATKQRKEENAAYEADISNLVTAQELVGKAIGTLSDYYAKLDQESGETSKDEVVLSGETDAVAETGEKFSKGQSGSGNKAITMLEMILEDTKKEEEQAHKDENDAQKKYEDLTQELVDTQEKLQKNLAKLKETLAQKEKELLQAQTDLKDTEADKAAIEKYLLSIKAGCDFMEENFDLREKSRAAVRCT